MSRRPSISIYDYPEDLNPFNDADPTTTATTTTTTTTTKNGSNKSINAEPNKKSTKEPKHKFWTFGRSKKKQRSNSFSIKSTWNGLFGKRRESPEVEIRKPTIATVSSTYKRGTYNGYPASPARLSKDQQEFNEALGTLARRRKYTLDNSSRYGSTLTVNGDPGRIYEGSPQDTTISILDNLTPKAPARRFGQVSPKPTEKIPPLDYNGKDEISARNGNVDLDIGAADQTPIPPKRGGPRASQRSLAPISTNEEVSSRSADSSMRDENENVPEDYVFKKFSRDAMRKSNLSINSCVSVGSTVSAYGRKKRRAPQPPCIREPLETTKESEARTSPSRVTEEPKPDELVESIDIARVTENIDEMTKRSRELDENYVPTCPARNSNENDRRNDAVLVTSEATSEETCAQSVVPAELPVPKSRSTPRPEEDETSVEHRETSDDRTWREKDLGEASGGVVRDENHPGDVSREKSDGKREDESFVAEREDLERVRKCDDSDAKFESSMEDCSFEYSPLRRRESSDDLSRSDSFSVKDEIEKIERQIRILEATKPRENDDRDDTEAVLEDIERTHTRMASLREQRNNFFRGMHENGGVKVELRELPREQNDIRLVRIEDPPVPNVGPTEPVRIIELHISEPIKQTPSIVHETRDVNPIPKPRRHSNLDLLASKETRTKVRHASEDDEKRGNSL